MHRVLPLTLASTSRTHTRAQLRALRLAALAPTLRALAPANTQLQPPREVRTMSTDPQNSGQSGEPVRAAVAADMGRRIANIAALPARIAEVLGFMSVFVGTAPAQVRARLGLRPDETHPGIEAVLDFACLVNEGASQLLDALDVAASEGATVSDRTLALRRDPRRAQASFRKIGPMVRALADEHTRDDAFDAHALAFLGLGGGTS